MEQDVLCLHNCVHLAHEMIHGCPAPANHVMARIHGELLSGGYFRLLIANSNMMRQDIVGRFRIEPERVEVVYPGYDPAKFNRDERDALRPWVRKQLKLGAKDVLIGLVTSGNFEKRNVDFFLRSVAKLPGELKPRCHFLVTGRESKVAHYKSLAKEVGLGRRVHFSDFTSRVQDSYHALDVCVLPAKLEEFGRVVLEAMACGLPVITSDRVGCSELFPSGSRALVFPSGDEDEFLRRLSALISHPDLRHKLGEGNLAVARNNREPEQGRRFESILRERGLI
jgi:UDP-glucose:(heptosyl)LPS alpha-1,3-glucosyltransferase